MTEITLLTEDHIWGSKKEKQLEVMYKYGTKAAVQIYVYLLVVIYAKIQIVILMKISL